MNIREYEVQFKTLYMPLGMYALRIVNNVDDAEDIVADAFMRAWEAIDNGSEISNFKGFMYRTVRNLCISHLRQQKEIVSIDSIPEPDDETIDNSVRDSIIWQAIDKLPEKCREVFLMSKRDGLTNEEISEELGISIKTVKNQITKAYSRLRSALSTNYKPFFLPFL